jgi:kynurenine formamidase
MTERPPYDSLPVFGADLPVRHAWEHFGPDHRLGTLAALTPERKLEALAVPRTGRCISLSLPLDTPSPPLFGRTPMAHRVHDRDRNTAEDVLEYLDLQGSSQWDGLRHVRARQYGVFNRTGIGDEREIGIDHWVRHGIVARGVLIDLPRLWAETGREIDPLVCARFPVSDIVRAARSQAVALRPGDLLLIRTGWLARYRADPDVRRRQAEQPSSIGLEATEDAARFLWDGGFSALATDNPAVEANPADPGGGYLHRLLIPALGMALGELWDLDGVAAEAAATGRYDCCVVSVPLHLPGGAGSPANAMAIV